MSAPAALQRVAKQLAFALATVVVAPLLLSYRVRALALGRDRALEGSSQFLSFVPGLAGQYLRRAFLARVLRRCHRTATVEFGTVFSQSGATIDEHVYIGPRCHLGLVHLERNVLLAAGVHVPSGGHTHAIDEIETPIREQGGMRTMVRIGEGSWIGSAAVVMADVGANCVIGAGAVVTRPLPECVVAAGVPARIVRSRQEGRQGTARLEQVG